MEKKGQCKDCVHFWPHKHNEYTGVCWLDGAKVDVKETCWWWMKRLTKVFNREDSDKIQEKRRNRA